MLCTIIDALRTDLTISYERGGEVLKVVDETPLTKAHATEVDLVRGRERLQKTRGGRKSYYLSGEGPSTIRCRFHERGEGWETSSERRVTRDGSLRERNVLKRPGEEDVVVDRYF